MADVDVTIVGGGIVGCSLAAQTAGQGLSTVLLEMETGLARATTSRNSEVSHGGMYYPTDSLKARFCVRGRRLLKEFCASAKVGYRECGKLIVAVEDDETPHLERLFTLGNNNGVEDLEMVGAADLAVMEPQIKAVAALHSPRTGILDAEGASKAYADLAAERGGQVMTGARVAQLDRKAGEWTVVIADSADGRREGWSHTSRYVINAAGLWADSVAALAGINVEARGWELKLSKGNYFAVADAHAKRVSRLIYPVPPTEGTSLGVHVCLDLGGQMRLGPDLQKYPQDVRGADPDTARPDLDYGVDPARGDSFFEDARRFLPWLQREDLAPSMCGFRPKLETDKFADFIVSQEEGDLEGLINLMGIESPGLTSAPAIAEHVGDLLREAEGS
jgi:L-2-hydroxyglutarate oxidase LhgO